jgi:DNA-binding NarL/FixJ family response regulator
MELRDAAMGSGERAVDRSATERARLCQGEAEVARLMAQGFTTHEIAEALRLSDAAVERHVVGLLAKCNLARI